MSLRLSVNGRSSDQVALLEWLRQEDGLRGAVKMVNHIVSQPGNMGGQGEILVQIVASIAGAGAAWATLASSISTFIIQRRADMSIDVIGENGEKYSITVERARDPQLLMETFLRLTSVNPPSDGE